MTEPKKQASEEVDNVCSAIVAMSKHWHLIKTLRGGTMAMRSAGSKYLPQSPGESDKAYDTRLNGSFLFNAYGDTVLHLSGRPFTRRARLSEKSPAFMSDWTKDVDLEGTSLTSFARASLESAIDFGLVHAIVDFPTTGGNLSASTERKLKVRPYFVLIPADSILGWRSVRHEGQEVLTQLRYMENAVVPVGEFGERLAERIRVFNRSLPGERKTAGGRKVSNDVGQTSWNLYEKNADNKWVIIGSGIVTINEIPLRTLYTNRQAFMTGSPALEDLAWKNLEHWQSASDQRNILHVARVPITFGAGIEESDLVDEEGNPIQIGPNCLITATNPQATLSRIGGSAESIEAGHQDLLHLMDEMAALGMAPMVQRKGGDATATEKSIEQSESISDLKSWVRNLEAYLSGLFDLGSKWVKQSDGADVDIYDDFAVSIRGGLDVSELRESRKAGDISRRQYLRELVRRGILAESFDPEANLAELSSEAPPVEPSLKDDDDEIVEE